MFKTTNKNKRKISDFFTHPFSFVSENVKLVTVLHHSVFVVNKSEKREEGLQQSL